MRRFGTIRILFLLTMILTLFACGQVGEEIKPETFTKEEGDFLIAVGTDLHIDPDARDEGAINPLTRYNQEITRGLIWDAKKEGADVLLLLGDLVNGGKKKQHEALCKLLKEAKKEELPVFVLPGNHDLTKIDRDDFVLFYEDYGYGDALSQDESSLSYSVRCGNHLFIMIDTGGYTLSESYASISPETLFWIEEELRYGEKEGLAVIVAGHYPILTEQATDFVGKDDLRALLLSYQVPLYLCGHLHSKSVIYDAGLTELATNQTISFPVSYSLIMRRADTSYEYLPRLIDMEGFVKDKRLKDKNLMHFSSYAYELFKKRAEGTVDILKRDRALSAADEEAAKDFIFQLEDYSWKGKLLEKSEALLSHPGYPVFMELAAGTNYEPWIPAVLHNKNPYLNGFRLKDGEISPYVD